MNSIWLQADKKDNGDAKFGLHQGDPNFIFDGTADHQAGMTLFLQGAIARANS